MPQPFSAHGASPHSLPVCGSRARNEVRGVSQTKFRLFNPVSVMSSSPSLAANRLIFICYNLCLDFSLEKLGHHQYESGGIRVDLEALSWDERENKPEGNLSSFQPYLGKQKRCQNEGTAWDKGGLQVRRCHFATFRLVLIHSLPIGKTIDWILSTHCSLSLSWDSEVAGKVSLTLCHRNMPVRWPTVTRPFVGCTNTYMPSLAVILLVIFMFHLPR